MRTPEVLSRIEVAKRFKDLSPVGLAGKFVEQKLLAEIEAILKEVPNEERLDTMGLISNGNRTWADEKNLYHSEGHIKGSETIIKAARFFRNLGINLMPWGFSTDNWKRRPVEKENLFLIIDVVVNSLLPEAIENNGRIIHMGRKSEPLVDPNGVELIPATPNFLVESLQKAEEATRGNTGAILALAINYSGEDEMTRIVKRFEIAKAEGKLASNTPFIRKYYAPFGDDRGLLEKCDLLLRTGGKDTLSGYGFRFDRAYFTTIETQLPDLTAHHIRNAFVNYAGIKKTRGA